MTDYQTKQRQQNLIVGGFVVIAFFAFIYLITKFRDLPLFVSKFQSFEVQVYFPEAPGIQKDTPVNYCGVQIGRVRHVSAPRIITTDQGRKTHKVSVTLTIDDEFKDIPDNVEIVIMKRGLGSSYIELRDTATTKPAGFLKNEMGNLKGHVEMASEFFPPDVQKKLQDTIDTMSDLMDNMNIIIGDSENQANFKATLENFAVVTAQAQDLLASIQELSDTGTEQVALLGDKFGRVSEELEGVLSEMRQLIAKIDSGQGTAGKLVNDGRLYENLLESSQELELTLQQLKEWAADAREKGVRIKW